jgi:hypothetical protein
VPEVSRFYGIVIRMYFADHPPPHFHAYYAGEEGVISIVDQALLSGSLPARALGLVAEWAALHEEELGAAWNRAATHQPPGRIEPLP